MKLWHLEKGASLHDVRSGLGREVPKSRRKEQNHLIYYVCYKGVKKSEHFSDVIIPVLLAGSSVTTTGSGRPLSLAG